MAATDSSVDGSSERMGAGAVLHRNGAFLPPMECRVSWPLASFRPEAADLHCLLDFTAQGEDLLVFIDSLDLLQAIMSWQRGDFWPSTHEHSHRSPSSHVCSNTLVSRAWSRSRATVASG